MYRVDEALQLSKNFLLSEFACKDKTDYITVNYLLIQKLQKLRDLVNKPITIVSGFRTRSYNASCGGAANSQHMYGNAADIQVSGMTPEMVYAVAKTIGFSGIGIYDTFVHVDVRPSGTWDGDERKINKGKTIPKIV